MNALGQSSTVAPALGAAVTTAPVGADSGSGGAEQVTCSQVLAALATQCRVTTSPERRVNQRYPYPRLVRLTPVGPNGEALVDETEVVVGKNLSQVGIGFFHQQRLPYRRVIVSLEASDGGWIAFLTDLTWRRFVGGGWYDSGGRFLRAMESPLPRASGGPASARS